MRTIGGNVSRTITKVFHKTGSITNLRSSNPSLRYEAKRSESRVLHSDVYFITFVISKKGKICICKYPLNKENVIQIHNDILHSHIKL